MSALFASFGLDSSPAGRGPEEHEKNYAAVCKPLAMFLNARPGFAMSLSLNAPFLEFLRGSHPEFIEAARKLVDDKRMEILGGGCCDPLFPLLFPLDRAGQTETLSALIRQTFSRRPRGLHPFASSWDSSLVSCFRACAMEFVILDSSLVPPDKRLFLPVVMSDRGKAIDIILSSSKFKLSPESDCAEYIAQARDAARKAAKSDGEDGCRILHVQYTMEEFAPLLESGALSRLADAAEKFQGEVEFSTVGRARKAVAARVPAFVSAGLDPGNARWAKVPYEKTARNDGRPATVHDFFQSYPMSARLFARSTYIGILISQYHGDRARKNAAREKLWSAQNGDALIPRANGSLAFARERQEAYVRLNEAEKDLRGPDFEEQAAAFDCDGDGMDEYLWRMKNFTCAAHAVGGIIREFDSMQSMRNYADNPSRVARFDGVDDGFSRGLFADFIMDDAEYALYAKGAPPPPSSLAASKYREAKFSGARKELILEARTLAGEKRQAASLVKKYTANSNGLSVQYILRNESGAPLVSNFVVELDFAQMNFGAEGFKPLKVEIARSDARSEIDSSSAGGIFRGASAAQITDIDGKLSFIIEPNENADISFRSVVFSRPARSGDGALPSAMALSLSMRWSANLEDGMEMEKTVSLSVVSMRKPRPKK